MKDTLVLLIIRFSCKSAAFVPPSKAKWKTILYVWYALVAHYRSTKAKKRERRPRISFDVYYLAPSPFALGLCDYVFKRKTPKKGEKKWGEQKKSLKSKRHPTTLMIIINTTNEKKKKKIRHHQAAFLSIFGDMAVSGWLAMTPPAIIGGVSFFPFIIKFQIRPRW